MLKKIRYHFEATAIKVLCFLLGLVSIEVASAIGSAITKFVGKMLPVNKLARRNLRAAMPELSENQIDDIIDGMWDNLGRVGGEFFHVLKFSAKDIEKYTIISAKDLEKLERFKAEGKGGIFFSGHLGNWEIGHKFLDYYGLPVSTVYRPLNNPVVEYITASARKTKLIPKGGKGAKEIVGELKKSHFIIILVDQRMSEGIKVPFFGRDALTPSSIANLALKYDVPLLPSRIIRIGKNQFRLEVEEPLEYEVSGNLQDDIRNITIKINQKLEQWIREYPKQWFWVHNRWKI